MSKAPVKLVVDIATGESKSIPLSEDEIRLMERDRVETETIERSDFARQQALEQARQKALNNRFSDEDVPKGKDWKELVLKLNARVEYLEKLLGVE
jgi:uncharacterized membrane protein